MNNKLVNKVYIPRAQTTVKPSVVWAWDSRRFSVLSPIVIS